jgi:hypothetical protein
MRKPTPRKTDRKSPRKRGKATTLRARDSEPLDVEAYRERIRWIEEGIEAFDDEIGDDAPSQAFDVEGTFLTPQHDISDGMKNDAMNVSEKRRKVLAVAPDQSHNAVSVEFDTLTYDDLKNVLRILKPAGKLVFVTKKK